MAVGVNYSSAILLITDQEQLALQNSDQIWVAVRPDDRHKINHFFDPLVHQ